VSDPDQKRGLYGKYRVERLVDPTDKHRDCRYYVLDLTHDAFAGPALRAYADACEATYPALARDLRALAPTAPASPPVGEPAPVHLTTGIDAMCGADSWDGLLLTPKVEHMTCSACRAAYFGPPPTLPQGEPAPKVTPVDRYRTAFAESAPGTHSIRPGVPFWVAEIPNSSPPFYWAKTPSAEITLGSSIYHDPHHALTFETREQCEAWIEARGVPFAAREHIVMAPVPPGEPAPPMVEGKIVGAELIPGVKPTLVIEFDEAPVPIHMSDRVIVTWPAPAPAAPPLTLETETARLGIRSPLTAAPAEHGMEEIERLLTGYAHAESAFMARRRNAKNGTDLMVAANRARTALLDAIRAALTAAASAATKGDDRDR
jgi:hypothetical protein